MRMGLRPPLLSFFKTRKTKTIMGHFDELLAKKVGTGRIQGAGTPSLTVTTTGNGTCTLDGNDVAGVLTFANTWADEVLLSPLVQLKLQHLSCSSSPDKH